MRRVKCKTPLARTVARNGSNIKGGKRRKAAAKRLRRKARVDE